MVSVLPPRRRRRYHAPSTSIHEGMPYTRLADVVQARSRDLFARYRIPCRFAREIRGARCACEASVAGCESEAE